jgi:chromosome segregation ATPase
MVGSVSSTSTHDKKLRILERKVEHWRNQFNQERNAGRTLKVQLARDVEHNTRALAQKNVELQALQARMEELTRKLRETEAALHSSRAENSLNNKKKSGSGDDDTGQPVVEGGLEQALQQKRSLTNNLEELQEKIMMAKSDHLLERERWLRMDSHKAGLELQLKQEVLELKGEVGRLTREIKRVNS